MFHRDIDELGGAQFESVDFFFPTLRSRKMLASANSLCFGTLPSKALRRTRVRVTIERASFPAADNEHRAKVAHSLEEAGRLMETVS